MDIKDDAEVDDVVSRPSNWRPLQIAFGVCGMFRAELPCHRSACLHRAAGYTRLPPQAPIVQANARHSVDLTASSYLLVTQVVLLSSSE